MVPAIAPYVGDKTYSTPCLIPLIRHILSLSQKEMVKSVANRSRF